ncbi:hypothetical protein DMC61_27510 [Amycolatopsis sp. WAC 04169]|uniref:hypothetical protein n=1 Tax=Amycolatopsis sp. WAC 04169 TaxID=2203197 RepID=UPI000F7697A0|nr:hypothetical protein [Amycolatopsis sp. WAC 04169]RSN25533.1 hypothetical protein DMC61_27510 [Amycolatopsis sp. WAC 04169]
MLPTATPPAVRGLVIAEVVVLAFRLAVIDALSMVRVSSGPNPFPPHAPARLRWAHWMCQATWAVSLLRVDTS